MQYWCIIKVALGNDSLPKKNFENLTKDIVIDWLKETLTIHQFREMDAVIETKIEKSGIYGSPWSFVMPTYEEMMVERTITN